MSSTRVWQKRNPERNKNLAESVFRARASKRELKRIEQNDKKASLRLEEQLETAFANFRSNREVLRAAAAAAAALDDAANNKTDAVQQQQQQQQQQQSNMLPKIKKERPNAVVDPEVRSELQEVFKCLDLEHTSSVGVSDFVAAARVLGIVSLTEEFIADQIWKVEIDAGTQINAVDFVGFCEMTMNCMEISELVGKTYVLLSGQGRKEALHTVMRQNKRDYDRIQQEKQRIRRERQLAEAEAATAMQPTSRPLSRAVSLFNGENNDVQKNDNAPLMMEPGVQYWSPSSNTSGKNSLSSPAAASVIVPTNFATKAPTRPSSQRSATRVPASRASSRSKSNYNGNDNRDNNVLPSSLVFQITKDGGDIGVSEK